MAVIVVELDASDDDKAFVKEMGQLVKSKGLSTIFAITKSKQKGAGNPKIKDTMDYLSGDFARYHCVG